MSIDGGDPLSRNDTELFVDLDHRRNISNGKPGVFNSTSAKNMRHVNILSAKEEALFVKSHASIKSRRSSKNQSPNVRKAHLRRPDFSDYFAGAGS